MNKTPQYNIEKMINDIVFIIDKVSGRTLEEFSSDEVLSSAISFKFIQISENAKRIPDSIAKKYHNVPWGMLNGLRNRIVHDYGNVKLDIIYNTIIDDLPHLLEELKKII